MKSSNERVPVRGVVHLSKHSGERWSVTKNRRGVLELLCGQVVWVGEAGWKKYDLRVPDSNPYKKKKESMIMADESMRGLSNRSLPTCLQCLVALGKESP